MPNIKTKKKTDLSREKAKRLLEVLISKQPLTYEVLNLEAEHLVWDYCIIVSANSVPHAEALLNELRKSSKRGGEAIHHIEKDDDLSWVLIDFFDVVVHIFSEEKLSFYRLDRLFKKSKKCRFRLPKQ